MSNSTGKKKKRTLFGRVRRWWARRRKGAYVAHHHEEELANQIGPYTNEELVDTFSVEEDLDSCCQGLLANGSPLFDSSPLLSKGDGSSSNSTATPELASYATIPVNVEEIPERGVHNFNRKTTQDSKQASLESLDSLAGSYVDMDDEESLETPKMANTRSPVESDDSLGEHVNFLRVQTQPRPVELVWKTENLEAQSRN